MIAKLLPGRTDNSIKNHWNSTIKRKLKMQAQQDDTPEDYGSIARQLSFSTPLRNTPNREDSLLLESARRLSFNG
jgi:hypothetical protein